MARRLNLHEEFCTILGNRNAYYQPPESVKMQYEAIRYELAGKDIHHANNKAYLYTNQYDGVLITRNPDSETPDKLLSHFEMISFGKSYTADNLYHFPFTLYY